MKTDFSLVIVERRQLLNWHIAFINARFTFSLRPFPKLYLFYFLLSCFLYFFFSIIVLSSHSALTKTYLGINRIIWFYLKMMVFISWLR